MEDNDKLAIIIRHYLLNKGLERRPGPGRDQENETELQVCALLTRPFHERSSMPVVDTIKRQVLSSQ